MVTETMTEWRPVKINVLYRGLFLNHWYDIVGILTLLYIGCWLCVLELMLLIQSWQINIRHRSVLKFNWGKKILCNIWIKNTLYGAVKYFKDVTKLICCLYFFRLFATIWTTAIRWPSMQAGHLSIFTHM